MDSISDPMYDLIHHSTAITLHNPYVDFSDSQSTSASRCVHSARAILTAYYRLYETSLDITRLHPLVVVGIHSYLLFVSCLCPLSQICWYLAAVVQIQLCKYFIEIGDVSRETTIWGEINVLRYESILSPFRLPSGGIPTQSHYCRLRSRFVRWPPSLRESDVLMVIPGSSQ